METDDSRFYQSNLDTDLKNTRKTVDTRQITKNFLLFVIETSSIHGFNHLAEKKRHPIEYILWFLGFLIGVIGIFGLSQSTWSRYQNNPTVVSIENNYQEWNTIFPAVTICPLLKVEPVMDDFTQALTKDPKSNRLTNTNVGELQSYMSVVSNWSLLNPILSEDNNYNKDYNVIKPNEYARLFVIAKNAFTHTLNYNEIAELEDEYLQVYMTEHGVCYGYLSKVANYYNPMDWKYAEYKDKGRPFGSNPSDGDNYFQFTYLDEAGIKVFIHSPEDLPDVASRGEIVKQQAMKTIGVVAISSYSSQDTYSLSIHQRQCRFLWESNLKISPVYTYNACRMQCRFNLGLKLCGCVPHTYKSFGKEKICNPDGLACLSKNEELLKKLRDSSGKRVECKCLAPCNDVNYVIDQERNIEWAFGSELRWGIIKYPQIRFKRSVLFGLTDVLVSFGGSAGLFLGCSVLSLVEIIYFFTLRLFWFIKRGDYKKF